jgi:hypothetical protein
MKNMNDKFRRIRNHAGEYVIIILSIILSVVIGILVSRIP